MKKKEILIFSLIIIITIISFFVDKQISQFLGNIRNYFILGIFVNISYVSSEIIISLFLTALFLFNKKKRTWILPLWISFALSAIISFLLKIIIQRQRPYQLGLISTLIAKTSHTIWNFSLPSFHTMLVFCALPIISKKYPKLKYIWIIFGIIVAFSRIYLGVHFLSDVLIGGLIGYFIGFFIVKREEKNKFWERIYKKIFKK